MARIRAKRGMSATLPSEAGDGELIGTKDTRTIYMGQGTGFPLVKMDGGSTGGSGGGSTITRYEAGAGTGCYVVATGAGVVITKVGNLATFSAPAGVQVLSASIHFATTEVGANTQVLIDYGINQGCGDNSDYTKVFAPQFQSWADVAGNRAFKTGATGTMNSNSHTLTVLGLTANMAIWINMSF